MTCRLTWDGRRPGTDRNAARWRPWSPQNDAPRIDERAETRGRSATKGGDEHAGIKRVLPVRAPASRKANGGNVDALRGHATDESAYA